jgi:hypothetical protein
MRLRWRTMRSVLYGAVTAYISVYWVRYGTGIYRANGLWEQRGIPLCVSGPITADSSACHASFVPSHDVHGMVLLAFFSREPSMPIEILQEMTKTPLTVTIAEPGGGLLWEQSYNQREGDPDGAWGVDLLLPDGCITRPVIPEGHRNWAQERPDRFVGVPAIAMRSLRLGDQQRFELTLDFPAGLPKELPGPVYAAAVPVDELAGLWVPFSQVEFLVTSVLLLIGVVVTFRSVFVVHAPATDPRVTAQESQPEG